MVSNNPPAKMSSKERFMKALRKQNVDRISVGNPTSVATVESMKICGAFFPEAHLNAEKMARLAATGYEILGYDTISPYFSVYQEAAALGCQVNWGEIDVMPTIRSNPYYNPDEVMIPGDFLEQSSIATVLDALRILKKEYGNHVCLVGKVMGPWTLAYHLYGIQNFLKDTILNPNQVNGFLNKLKKVTLMFAKAQFEAGADVVTLADHITGDLVGPRTYLDYLLPIHQEITKSIKGPLILHICGKTTDRLSHIAKAGFAAFHFDSKNLLAETVNIASDEGLTLIGNIENPNILLNGSFETIYNAVKEAFDAGIKIIAPECAVPISTPNYNLKSIVDAIIILSNR